MCLFVALCVQRVMRMRRIVNCGLSDSIILSHKRHDFRKKVIVFRFSLYILSKTFLILRRTERDMIKNVFWSSCLLLLLLALQPTVGFSLLSGFLPFFSFFTLLSPPSYSHYLQIFFIACNPSVPWSPSNSRTYRL